MRRTLLGAIRTVVGGAVVILATLFFGAVVWVLAVVRPNSPSIERAIRAWSRVFLAALGVRLTITGRERVNPSGSYVFVSNHLSNLDIPVHFLTAPAPIRYLAKKELFKMPYVGPIARRVGIIRVDRQAAGTTLDQINREIEAALARGHSLMIYPEGTRSRDGEMRPFKRGAFRIAMDHGLAVVPIAVEGTHRAWPPGSKLVFGGRVRAVMHEPIAVEGMTNVEELTSRVEAIITDSFAALRAQS